MNQLAVAIAIILFPGLIASVICDKVTVHYQRWDIFKYGVYSFVFGLLSYALLQGLVGALSVFDRFLPGVNLLPDGSLSAWTLVTDEKYKINLVEVLWATALAPALSALAAATINLKAINRLAKWARISRKYGDENLFSFFLNAEEVNWIYVRDKSTGLTYCGKVLSFAEYNGIQEIVLSDAEVFEYESSEKLYSLELVYLAKPAGQFIIEVPSCNVAEETHGKEANQRRIDARDDQSTDVVREGGGNQKRDPRGASTAAAADQEAEQLG